MRTIATTFDSRSQAEAASRLLQGIGVDPELILLRDLAGAPDAGAAVRSEAPASDGAQTGGTFLSAKVAPDQVAAASEILKGVGTGAGVPPASAGGAAEMDGKHPRDTASVAAVGGEPPLTFGGAPAQTGHPREPSPAPAHQDQVRRESQNPAGHRPSASAGSGAGEWKRPLTIFLVAVVAAFVVGLLLGQVA